MANTIVGSLINSDGAGKLTQAITTVNVEDSIILGIQITDPAISFTALNSDRCRWDKIATVSSGSGVVIRLEIWHGIVGTVGADTITATPSAAIGATVSQWTGRQYHSDIPGAGFEIEDAGLVPNGGSSVTSMAYPTLTSDGPDRVYAGLAVPENVGSAGATAGFTYDVDGFTSVLASGLAVGAGTVGPTANSTSGQYVAGAVVLAPVVRSAFGEVLGAL